MSEIDDIFSSEGKNEPTQPVASTSTLQGKKKNKKKRKHIADSVDIVTPSHPAPETVIDPSILIEGVKRPKIDRDTAATKVRASKSTKAAVDSGVQDRFNDSRGSETRRKTEEGWSIYKEDELGIKDEGGDTPLCPFDCECCF